MIFTERVAKWCWAVPLIPPVIELSNVRELSDEDLALLEALVNVYLAYAPLVPMLHMTPSVRQQLPRLREDVRLQLIVCWARGQAQLN